MAALQFKRGDENGGGQALFGLDGKEGGGELMSTILLHIDYGVGKDCINSASYGEICVRCNACGRFDKETQRECALRVWQEELHEQYCFDNWADGMEALQRQNIASNIEYFQEKILRLVAEAIVEGERSES